MDSGPRPMKNMKVTEKNRNCVDRFWDDHQADFEARGKLSKDDIDRVNQHNLTYPRLGVELDKRKSLSKARANYQKNDSSKRPYDVDCAACTKLRRLSQLQKNTLKPKSKQKKIKSKTRYRDIKSRVQKNRYRTQKRNKTRLHKTISVNKMMKCRCCYVPVQHKRVGNDMSTILNVEPLNSDKSNDMSNKQMNSMEKTDCLMPNEGENDLKSEAGKTGDSTIKTLKNPDTSTGSMSSYNSYESLDHEPMVNMEL